jgi:Holliday junction resolvase RusA-like endonuclease
MTANEDIASPKAVSNINKKKKKNINNRHCGNVEISKMIKLIIPQKPIAKKRPRFASKDRKGRPLDHVRAINDQETEEGRFLFHVYKQWKEEPLKDAIFLQVIFYMPIPKGTSGKKVRMMESREIEHTKKPDLDNLIKFTKDCLNGIVWKDDAQVCSIIALKQYDPKPQTIISIFGKELGD